MKSGGRLIKHARYYWLLLAESYLTRQLFAGMLQRIVTLPVPPADCCGGIAEPDLSERFLVHRASSAAQTIPRHSSRRSTGRARGARDHRES